MADSNCKSEVSLCNAGEMAECDRQLGHPGFHCCTYFKDVKDPETGEYEEHSVVISWVKMPRVIARK